MGIQQQLLASYGVVAYLPSNNPSSLVAWFRKGVGVTSSGGFASQWDDQSGNGHHLVQATGTNQPAYDGSAILTFDGVDNFMKCVAFTLNQPTQVSILMNPVSWTDVDTFFDGNTNFVSCARQRTTTPSFQIVAATAPVADNTNATLGAYHAITVLFNGAGSSALVDSTTATTGDPGAGNAGGFALGSAGGGTARFSNIEVKEIIIRNVDDSTIRANDHAYLQTL